MWGILAGRTTLGVGGRRIEGVGGKGRESTRNSTESTSISGVSVEGLFMH